MSGRLPYFPEALEKMFPCLPSFLHVPIPLGPWPFCSLPSQQPGSSLPFCSELYFFSPQLRIIISFQDPVIILSPSEYSRILSSPEGSSFNHTCKDLLPCNLIYLQDQEMNISEGINYYADLRYSKTNKHTQKLKDY